MTPATVSNLKPRMTQMSWREVRETLDDHQSALSNLYGNCESLRVAIGGDVVDGKLVSPSVQSFQALRDASFIGRLRWLLTGRL